VSAKKTSTSVRKKKSRSLSLRLPQPEEVALNDLEIALGGVSTTEAILYAIRHVKVPGPDEVSSSARELSLRQGLVRAGVRARKFAEELSRAEAATFPPETAAVKNEVLLRARRHLENLATEWEASSEALATMAEKAVPGGPHPKGLTISLVAIQNLQRRHARAAEAEQDPKKKRELEAYAHALEMAANFLRMIGVPNDTR
jgi:hypothetical protein